MLETNFPRLYTGSNSVFLGNSSYLVLLGFQLIVRQFFLFDYRVFTGFSIGSSVIVTVLPSRVFFTGFPNPVVTVQFHYRVFTGFPIRVATAGFDYRVLLGFCLIGVFLVQF